MVDPRRLADRLDHAAALDGPVRVVRNAARRALPRGPLKDALHGTWLGHPLHPMLTDVPIGFWTSSLVLDLAGGRAGRKAADRLLALGVVTALPTATAGLADWTELDQGSARTGLVHAAANWVGLGFYTASLVARRRGRRARGVTLALAGGVALTVGGYLGGHLSYNRAAGVSRQGVLDFPEDWVVVLDQADLPDRRPVAAHADGIRLVLYREDDRIHALAAVCPHQGGPLEDGEIVATEAGSAVVCPWHQSEFALADGGVQRGPAQSAAASFDVRVDGGKIAVRRRVGA